MIWRPSHHIKLAQAADALTTAGSFVVAFFVWDKFRHLTGVSFPIRVTADEITVIIGFSLLWVIIFNMLGAYSYQRFTSLWKELTNVVKTTFIGVCVFFAAHFFLRFGQIPRTYILAFTFVNLLFLALEKTALFYLAKELRKRGINRKRVLIIGNGDKAREFIDVVKKNIEWGLDIVGIVKAAADSLTCSSSGVKILGTYEDIEPLLHDNIIDEIIVCLPIDQFGQIRKVIECCEREGVQMRIYSDFFCRLVKKVRVDQPYGMNIISLMATTDDELKLYIKRLLDIWVSGVMLIVLSPLFLILTLLIKATSKGPILYQWNVVGLNKKPFKSWKFRTMVLNADQMKTELLDRNEMAGPVFKIKNDPRVTKIGKVMRRFSLDELPQLCSVFKGDMSLVGPRPAGPHELARYDSWHRRKLSVKPGITCLWQVQGRNKISDFDDWVRLDLEYIENWSLGLDLEILLRTALVVLKGTGS
jgi:exopolysaccharide biosynthesis polyprenyl glycosylphosphotransferase